MDARTKKITSAILLTMLIVALRILYWVDVSGTAFCSDCMAVWVFDVGQGDAIYIDAPQRDVLVDGGVSDVVLERLGMVMAPWDGSVDIMVNTHPHADHVTGLVHVLRRLTVSVVMHADQSYGTDIFQTFRDVSDTIDVVADAGDMWELGDDVTMTVLWPEQSYDGAQLADPNEGSIVLLIEAQGRTILLTGDIGVEQELALRNAIPNIDILKVGHQGSLTSTASTFLESIDPEYAVVSVGENSYGHPDPIVMDRLATHVEEVYRTDIDGSVRFLIKNGQVSVRTFRHLQARED